MPNTSKDVYSVLLIRVSNQKVSALALVNPPKPALTKDNTYIYEIDTGPQVGRSSISTMSVVVDCEQTQSFVEPQCKSLYEASFVL